jgi:SAM-dependent methyltransferase
MTIARSLTKLPRSIRRRGWRGTASEAWTRYRRSRTGRLHLYVSETWFDRRHDVQTRGLVFHDKVGAFEHAFRYEATRRARVKRALSAVPGRPEDFTFIDLGCGRGLMLLLAGQRHYRRIIGVELSAELCESARENARSYRGRGAPLGRVEVVRADATTWELPAEPLVVYVYNSFALPAFEMLAENVARSLRDHPRELFLLYMFPESRAPLDAVPELEVLNETKRYVLYRSRAAGQAAVTGES